MTPDEMFANLLAPDLPGYLDNGAGRLKRALEEHWPSTDHPENIYARDRSVKQFAITGTGPESRTIENTAEYSGYTDGGFTFRGPKTALPWAERGAAPYTEQIADARVEAEAQALLDHITGDRRG